MADSRRSDAYGRDEGNAPAPSSRRSRWDRAAEDTGPQPQPGEVREENTYSYLKQDQQITGNDGQYSASDRVNYSDSTGYTDQWRTESHHDLSSRSKTFTDHERDMSSGGQLAEDPVTGQSGRAQNYSGGGFGVRTDPERQSSWMREDIDGQPLGRRYSDDEAQKRKFIEAFGSTYAQKSDSDDSDSSPSESSPEPSPKKAAGFTMTMDRSSKPAAAPQSMKATGFSMTMNKAPSLSQKTTVTLSSGSISKKPVAPIKMSLGAQKPKAPQSLKKPAALANVFNESDDSEEDEMPAEAKMRMRNLGRETPTAAGPNSFGKGRLGFCDRQKIIQRELQKKMDDVRSHPTHPKEET